MQRSAVTYLKGASRRLDLTARKVCTSRWETGFLQRNNKICTNLADSASCAFSDGIYSACLEGFGILLPNSGSSLIAFFICSNRKILGEILPKAGRASLSPFEPKRTLFSASDNSSKTCCASLRLALLQLAHCVRFSELPRSVI